MKKAKRGSSLRLTTIQIISAFLLYLTKFKPISTLVVDSMISGKAFNIGSAKPAISPKSGSFFINSTSIATTSSSDSKGTTSVFNKGNSNSVFRYTLKASSVCSKATGHHSLT